MHNAIINKYRDELKQYSQHNLPVNTFFIVSTSGLKYGIWEFFPVEILYQLYEGLIKYVLDYFFQKLLMQVEID